MSGAADEYLEYQERGLQSISDKDVCASHIEEHAIARFIRVNGASGKCSYCQKKRTVVSLEQLMFYITDCIGHFYTDPANFMSYDSSEGGYLGTVYDASELLDDCIGLVISNDNLRKDIHNSFSPFRSWANEYEYYNTDADYKMEHWNYFKEVVKSKSRYLFTTAKGFKIGNGKVNAFEILKEIGKIVRKQGLVIVMSTGTVLHRCRQHANKNDITDASHICSPPSKFAVYPNRMSPAGISMFYCAFDKNTAVSETIDKSNNSQPYYTTAIFKTLRPLNILTLTVPKLPSMFDQRRWKEYDLIAFLRAFIKDVTKSIVKDGRLHVEYVPTQIVTEFFRYSFTSNRKNIDGIIYTSSKRLDKKVCVLFMDDEESLKELEFDGTSLLTQTIV